MTPAARYEFGGTSPAAVVDGVCRSLGVGGTGGATRDELLLVVGALAGIVSGMLVDAVGDCPGGVVAMPREDSDTLAWRANRDSGDSSLRPSGDAYKGGSGSTLKGHADERERQRREGTVGNGATSGNDTGTDDGKDAYASRTDGDTDGTGANTNANANGADTSGDGLPEGMPEGLTPEEAEEWSQSKALHDQEKGLRERTGRKPGKQPGSKGHGMRLPEGAVRLEERYAVPVQCAGCPNLAGCAANVESGRPQNVVDIVVSVTLRPLRCVDIDVENCPFRGGGDGGVAAEADGDAGESAAGDGSAKPRPIVALVDARELTGEGAPEGGHPTMPRPEGTNLYGPTLVALVACLYCVTMASFQRARDILAPMTGTTLSVGTLKSMVSSMAELVTPAVDGILRVLREGGGVVNCDGTGVNVDGRNNWIHSACTSLYTFLSVQVSRGSAGLDAAGFLRYFAGTVVHDCFVAYWGYDVVHALCNAHLLRDLEALRKWFRGCADWALEMSDLLLLMRDTRDEYAAAGHRSLPENVRDALRSLYEGIVAKGLEACPEPVRTGKRGRPKQGKARSLLLRMQEREDCFLLFLDDFDVPFTNYPTAFVIPGDSAPAQVAGGVLPDLPEVIGVSYNTDTHMTFV